MASDEPTVMTQAERVIEKFGGPKNLARIIGRDVATVYKWMYPKTKGGTGGLIPTQALTEVMAAARQQGIFLTTADLFPGR